MNTLLVKVYIRLSIVITTSKVYLFNLLESIRKQPEAIEEWRAKLMEALEALEFL